MSIESSEGWNTLEHNLNRFARRRRVHHCIEQQYLYLLYELFDFLMMNECHKCVGKVRVSINKYECFFYKIRQSRNCYHDEGFLFWSFYWQSKTHENRLWRKVAQMQPMRLCLYLGKQFEETFKNSLSKRKITQMQPMRICIRWSKQIEDTFENSLWRKIVQV